LISRATKPEETLVCGDKLNFSLKPIPIMAYGNISYDMPAENLAELEDMITGIAQHLPFLVNLSPDERQQVLKLAPRDADFVNDMRFATINFADAFPTLFDIAEYHRDILLFDQLSDVRQRVESLFEKIRFTEMALGGEIMAKTNQGYKFVQAAAKVTPGIQSLAEKMKHRYKNAGRKKADPDAQ
jgi:hypothetical protein